MRGMLAIAIFLAGSALPLLAQDSEVDRLKKELEKSQRENAELLQSLKAQSARLEELLRASPPKAVTVPVPAAPRMDVGSRTSILPRKSLEARVTAIANEIGLVVITVGKDDVVVEGDEFTLVREGAIVAKIVIDRCDRKWSAGKVIQKNLEPCVGDHATSSASRNGPGTQALLDSVRITVAYEKGSLSELLQSLSEMTGVKFELDPPVLLAQDPWKRDITFKVADLSLSNTLKLLTAGQHLQYRVEPDGRVLLTLPAQQVAAVALPGAPATGRPADSVQELRALRKELDDVRTQVRVLSDRLISSWREEGLATEDLSEALRSQLNLSQGIAIRQVREGSRAAQVGLKAFDVICNLEEPELLRLLREGGKITLYRQGTKQTIVADPSR
jgi:DNA-binding transcriptional ArsR family regulator